MSRKVKQQITDIKETALTKIPGICKHDPDMSYHKYMSDCRIPLNMMVVGTLIGGEFKLNKKDQLTIKFKAPLPNAEEIAEIIAIMNTYITSVENVYLTSADAADVDDEDDMAIQVDQNVELNTSVNKRSFVELLSDKNPIINELLTEMDLINIAAMGAAVRRKERIKKAIIIGGITILVAGATGIIVAKTSKSRREADMIEDPVDDDLQIDISDDDLIDATDDLPDTVEMPEL